MSGPTLYRRRDTSSNSSLSSPQNGWAGRIRGIIIVTLFAGAFLMQWLHFSEESSTIVADSSRQRSVSSRAAATKLPSIEEHKAALRYMGDKTTNTGWNVDELCLQRRRGSNGEESPLIVYGVGAGEDISWDIGMIEKYGANVIIIDPTEKARRHVESVLSTKSYGKDPTRVQFLAEGLSDRQGEIVFALPANPDHVSMRSVSMADASMTRTVSASVRRLQDFMSELGHDYLDVLKIDIEGAEYDVLEALLREKYMPFTQLLVEYHDRFLEGKDKSRHTKLLKNLNDAGFIELWSQHGGQERGYVKASDLEYCATGVGSRNPRLSVPATTGIRLRK
jgi:FkbM family methyltransferase